MDTRHLQYFLAVVEAGTVSAAAQQLHLTQPSLSRQIRQLETQLGLTLFHRRNGRLRLTSGGREFHAAASDLIRHHRETAQLASQLAKGEISTVSLAAPATTLTDILAPFVATFEPEDPVPSVAEIAIDADIIPELSEFDLVLSPGRPSETARSLHLATLPVWAYVPRTHAWADREAVTLTELGQETLILPTGRFKARRVIDAALDAEQIAPARTLESEYSQVAQALAAAGRGAAILTDDPRYGLHGLRILGVSGALQIHLYASWRGGHHAETSLEALAERLRSFCRERYPTQAR
ncbi:LysR family transcriptional regulator [Nesterenkonia lutea]|uniref:DNA-binding transcriptional LysR family regulator n=1 Tax=Nesterenkonia lutea TaxID=272919 RepID=A0ABR9JHA7_9MICC|nr:LysR family transcriptional regulator [Nesterenkonia lutea]MBE1525320.1 DNA-binding transcriptional LysR family regulator [Nesterenkonia lutea]